MAININKLSKDLETLQSQLKPLEPTSGSKVEKFVGRAIKHFKEGFERLESLFKGVKFETLDTKAKNAIALISKEVTSLESEYEKILEDYSKVKQDYPLGHFQEFNKDLAKQIVIMKNICTVIKEKTDVKEVEKHLDILLSKCETLPKEFEKELVEERQKASEALKKEERVPAGFGKRLEEAIQSTASRRELRENLLGEKQTILAELAKKDNPRTRAKLEDVNDLLKRLDDKKENLEKLEKSARATLGAIYEDLGKNPDEVMKPKGKVGEGQVKKRDRVKEQQEMTKIRETIKTIPKEIDTAIKYFADKKIEVPSHVRDNIERLDEIYKKKIDENTPHFEHVNIAKEVRVLLGAIYQQTGRNAADLFE